MAKAFATDRLSALSDNLLSTHILSKISYRDVVRFSLLSQRWRFLWKKIPFLNFWFRDFEKQKDDDIRIIINNALLQLDVHLCCLDLEIALDYTSNATVNNWIRLAAEKQVERMFLQICRRNPKTGKRLNRFSMVQIGDSLFNRESLTNLQLRFILFPKIPTNFGDFRSLTTFYCYEIVGMQDAMFERFMDVCPHLRNLGIRFCLGLKNLKIRASYLMYLNLGVLIPNISLQMACPQLTEISLMDHGRYRGLKLLEGISGAESVKIITLQNYDTCNGPLLPSITVLNGFPRLEKLIMHGQCFQEMISGEDPEEQVTLPKLKMVRAHIGPDKGGRAVSFLGSLLRKSELIVTRVFLSQRCSNIMRNKLLDLEKEFPVPRLFTATRRWSLKYKEICEFCDTHPEY